MASTQSWTHFESAVSFYLVRGLKVVFSQLVFDCKARGSMLQWCHDHTYSMFYVREGVEFRQSNVYPRGRRKDPLVNYFVRKTELNVGDRSLNT